MNSQAAKPLLFVVVLVLTAGLMFLGYEVKTLRAELHDRSMGPTVSASATVPQANRDPLGSDLANSSDGRNEFFSDLERVRRQMDRLFAKNLDSNSGLVPAGNFISVNTDIQDAQDKYVVSMDIPGMEKDNINVEVKGHQLMVSGERKSEEQEKGSQYYRQERSLGYFSQSLMLPSDASSEGIKVNYVSGVLRIEVPKLVKVQNAQEPTKIQIN